MKVDEAMKRVEKANCSLWSGENSLLEIHRREKETLKLCTSSILNSLNYLKNTSIVVSDACSQIWRNT